jgi:hypothetical protein
VAARDIGVVEDAICVLRAAEGRDRAVQDVAPVVDRDDRPGLRVGLLGAALRAGLLGLGRRVDHGVPVLALGRLGTLTGRRPHQPGLDPELAEPQALVLIEADDGAGEQVVVVAASVLEQVPAELLGERALVVLETGVVVRGEPDRVLVRDVDALHRRGLVRVHLLGELPCDLDRLHAGAECAAEDALD